MPSGYAMKNNFSTMAKTLLIRELTTGANQALEVYKRRHGIAVNTEACMSMLERYHRLENELEELRRTHDFLRRQVADMIYADTELANANKLYTDAILSLQNTYQGHTKPAQPAKAAEERRTLMDIFEEE